MIVSRAALRFCCAFLLLAIVSAAQAHDKEQKLNAAQVFLSAADRTDLRAPGSSPYELLADIELEIRGQRLNGTYLLLWDSPQRWREEVVLPGYKRIRIQGPNGVWLDRNLDYEIPSVEDLDNALGFTDQLRQTAKLKIGKLRTTRISGSELACSHVKIADDFADGNYCFDLQQLTLDAELFPNGANEAPNITSVRYSNFATFGEKLYPRTTRIFSGDDAFLTFTVQKLVLLFQPPPSDFAPPSGARLMGGCPSAKAAKLIKKVLPTYPTTERSAGRTAHIVLYALIAADGSVQNARVIFPAADDFNSAALAAVRQWRYQPTVCNGTPGPVETYITVYFAL